MARLTKFLDKNAFKLLALWLIVLFLLYSALSILRHNHFQSGGFDLGLYDQTVWKYAHFQKPYNTIKDRFILGDHLNLTLPLLAPLYWIREDIKFILIFQAIWLSFSSFAIYKLAKARKFSNLVSFNLAFVYSFFYGIQYAVFFDFHAVTIGVGLIAWLAYFLESKHQKLLWITVVLLILTQENMGLALTCLGLIYFFKRPFRRLAIGFILGGLVWSLLAAKIVTFFSPTGFQYWPTVTLNPIGLIAEFFNSQEKRLVWLYSLSWFSFLPLFSAGSIAAISFDLAQYFVTGPEFSRMWSPYMHHRAILAPYLILGTIGVLEFLRKKKIKPELISLILIFSALSQQYLFHFPLNKLSKPAYWQNESWMADNQALFKLISSDVSLATQQNLIPHLSHRQNIYLIWPREHDFDPPYPCGQRSCWWLDFGGKPQYLLVDLRPNQWLTQILESNENFQSAVKNMERANKITLEKQINFAKLYRITNE